MKKNGRFTERLDSIETPPPSRRAAGLAAVFSLREPRTIQRCLVEDDPCRLRERCERRLARSGYLLPPERVWLRAAARLAYRLALQGLDAKHIPLLPGPGCERRLEQRYERWMDLKIEETLHELVSEQADEERLQTPLQESPDQAFYAELARGLGSAPAQARRLCVRWNALPRSKRRGGPACPGSVSAPAPLDALTARRPLSSRARR